MILYKAIIGIKSNIDYIKTLKSIVYVSNPKTPKSRKSNNKTINDILFKFEYFNNYSIYSPSQNKVISSRDVIIENILMYNKSNVININLILIIESSPDYNIIKPYIN